MTVGHPEASAVPDPTFGHILPEWVTEIPPPSFFFLLWTLGHGLRTLYVRLYGDLLCKQDDTGDWTVLLVTGILCVQSLFKIIKTACMVDGVEREGGNSISGRLPA